MGGAGHLITRSEAIGLAALTLLAGCGSDVTDDVNTSPAEEDEAPEDALQEEALPGEKEADEVDYLVKFVDEYNVLADVPLEIVERFDPHDSSGGHYRHEFYTDAYDGSVGAYCIAGDLKAWAVNYGSHGGFYQNERFRVYFMGPRDDVVGAFCTAVGVFDPGVSADDLDRAIGEELERQYPTGNVLVDSSDLEATNLGHAETKRDCGEYVQVTTEQIAAGLFEAMVDSRSYADR